MVRIILDTQKENFMKSSPSNKSHQMLDNISTNMTSMPAGVNKLNLKNLQQDINSRSTHLVASQDYNGVTYENKAHTFTPRQPSEKM